jgi:hypothetical protein
MLSGDPSSFGIATNRTVSINLGTTSEPVAAEC